MKAVHLFFFCVTQGFLICVPISTNAMDEEIETTIKQLHLPRLYLDGLKDAQRIAKELRSLAFYQKAYKPKLFTDEQRNSLKDTTLRFEYLTWDIKRKMDESLAEQDKNLRHSIPAFDSNGNPVLQDPFYFTFTALTSIGPKKANNSNVSSFDFYWQQSDKIHEIAYRAIMRFVGTLLEYIIFPEHPKLKEAIPTSPGIAGLERLMCQRIAMAQETSNITESHLSALGFELTYNGKSLHTLTSVHLADQNSDGFRAAIRNYKKTKLLPDQHIKEAYQWHSLKLERLKRILSGFQSQLPSVLEFLMKSESLQEYGEINLTPNGLIPNNPSHYVSFEDMLFRGLQFEPTQVPYPIDVLEKVQVNLKSIWPRGAGKSTDLTSMEMLKLFCEIMEERLRVSVKVNQTYLPPALRAIAETSFITPSQTYEVKKHLGKRSLVVFKTHPFEIHLTRKNGYIEEFKMSEFMKLWGSLTSTQQQLLLSLQLFELIFSHVEMGIYITYQSLIERFFNILKDPKLLSSEFIDLPLLWLEQSELIKQRNVDKFHLFTHVYSPHNAIADILAYIGQNAFPYNTVTAEMFDNLDQRTLTFFSKDRALVNIIVRILNHYSPFIPTPAPQTPWKPGEWLTYMKIAPEVPQVLQNYVGKNLQSRDIRPVEVQLRQVFKTKARTAYDYPQSEAASLFPDLAWVTLIYYIASWPKSWADLDELAGLEKDEYIHDRFDAFFKWYWKHRDAIAKGGSPQVLAEDLET